MTSTLIDYVSTTHDQLAARLADARQMVGRRDNPRLERIHIDAFLATTSRHLHAVDAVMMPPFRKLHDPKLCHDYRASAKALGVLMVHVKAHEYGSTFEAAYPWPKVWGAVDDAVGAVRDHEEHVAERLTDSLEEERVEELAERLARVEPREPTRPHPYQPHVGLLGSASRGLMRIVDSAWDAAEGRIVPEPPRAPKKAPGRLGQYLLASPRFGDEEDER